MKYFTKRQVVNKNIETCEDMLGALVGPWTISIKGTVPET